MAPDPSVGLSGLWPGPAPQFPLLAPESRDTEDYYFRCPDCGELFAVGTWLKDGNLIECDVAGCHGQFYYVAGEGRADTQAPSPASAGADSEPTPQTPSRGRFGE